ncbi:hypothetical protein ACFPZL_12280, partial [Leucobacter soli]
AERRLSLVLNRAETSPLGLPQGPSPAGSRGVLVLDEASGRTIPDPPGTANFNLVGLSRTGARVTSWDGTGYHRTDLEPGMHMIAHHDVDDAVRTPRIAHWLPAFREVAGLPDAEWREQWIGVLDESTRLAVDDDRAIIRDNRRHGYATLSLLVCLAELRPGATGDEGADGSLSIDTAVLAEPAHWQRPAFERISA